MPNENTVKLLNLTFPSFKKAYVHTYALLNGKTSGKPPKITKGPMLTRSISLSAYHGGAMIV